MIIVIITLLYIALCWVGWFLWWEHKEREAKKWRLPRRIEKTPRQVKTILSRYLEEEDNDQTIHQNRSRR